MPGEALMAVLDYILNQADDRDLQAIHAALERRGQDLHRIGSVGVSPKDTAKQLSGQLESSLKQTRNMLETSVRKMAIDVIRREAPELTDEQIGILLREWIPDENQRAHRTQEAMNARSKIPWELLKKMVSDFLSFSTGKMSASYQLEMEEQIPGWSEVYWQKFPLRVRKLIRLYLEGQIDPDTFWEEVKQSSEEAHD